MNKKPAILIFLLIISSTFITGQEEEKGITYYKSLGYFVEPYYFSTGEYYILDYPVNIREQPNLQGKIVGKLGKNAKIEILENAENPQEIENVYSEWYKIKHGDVIGYIWGGYIAEETLICDIDKNGILDYFHYRTSRAVQHYYHKRAPTDIFIYINGEKIDTSRFVVRSERGTLVDSWGTFQMSNLGNKVRFKFSSESVTDIFDVTATGEILFIETQRDTSPYQ